MAELRIEELSASTIVAVNALSLKPGQEQFVAPVSYAAAAAVNNPATTWQRVVLDGDEVVGFIQGDFDEEADEYFKSVLWRINVDAEAQRRGVGKFAVEALGSEALQRGFTKLHVMFEPGELGPEQFFLAVGFSPVDETEYGEVVGQLDLS